MLLLLLLLLVLAVVLVHCDFAAFCGSLGGARQLHAVVRIAEGIWATLHSCAAVAAAAGAAAADGAAAHTTAARRDASLFRFAARAARRCCSGLPYARQ